MLEKIIHFSINNKLIVGIFILFLILFGSYQFTKLPIDAVPDITDNQVQVITITPALGAPDVERLITFPVEQANSNIPGLKQIRSFSRFGLSVVTIVFEDKIDVYWARQQVTERLLQVQDLIPKSFGTPFLAPVTTGLGEIYQYSIRPKAGYENKYSAMDLRTIQDWIVRKQLLGVKGVADVASFGGLLKQYEIAVNPLKLKASNVTISDVFAALENNNQNTGGAYIEKGPTLLFIRSEGLVGSIEDIQSIVVKNLSDGSPLLIRDIADVHFGNATRYGAMTYNGKEQVAGAVVMMLKGANSSEVIGNVKDRIAQIQKTLPKGVVIDAFLDRTKMVNNAVSTVRKNLMEGALIVVFVLVMFLGNLRAGLLVASIIPLAMLFAVIMMNLFGVSGNLMSLGALDFGLIVDGAVIIVEAVMHGLANNKRFGDAVKLTQPQMNDEVKENASRMMNSAVFGQIIILIVYLPIFSLQGIEGKMFLPMAQTVAFALLGAFLLSLTYVPMMSSLVLTKKTTHKRTISDKVMDRVLRSYQHTLDKALRIPKTILTVVIVVFGIAVFVLTQLGGEFIPSLEEGDFAVETRVLTGSNLNTSIDAVSKASKLLLAKFPEVQEVVGKTGSSEIPTDPMPIDASDMMVILKDKKDWTSAKTFPEIEAKMSKELEAIPGVTFGFQYPVQMRFNELMSGARQDVVCKIFGEDLDTLALYAKKLGSISSSVKGSSGLYVEQVTGMPQIIINYNRASIAQYGLNISDINKVVNTAFAGQTTGLVFEGEKRFDLVVRLSSGQRRNLEDVQNLLIPTPQGTQIPLYQVARVDVQEGPNQIQREDAQRRIIVGFNVRGRDVQSMVKELQQKVEQQLKLPPGYHVTYGGAFENLEAAKQRLSIAVPISLLLILLMLYFAFYSFREGLIIYSAIPLSAMGGIFALAIRGLPFSISAGVGFIALFGVAVLNGIVLISEFNRIKKDGEQDLKKIVTDGTSVRLRPVLITAFVASLGFLPMALSNGAGAEVQRPLATVVIGGLLIATFLTLFVLPILFILFEKRKMKKSPVKGITVFVIIITGSLLSAGGLKAQTSVNSNTIPITLQAAIDTALKNNLAIRNEQLNAQYLQRLTGTAFTIPQTNASVEYGQINSYYNDNRFALSQTIKFPTVYIRQKELYNEEWKSGLFNIAIRQKEIKRSVSETFNELVYLQQKQKLLQHSDSIYANFLEKAGLRFATGESNILEKTTAETQRGQVRQQLRQLEQDYSIVQLQLKLLLNSSANFTPQPDSFKLHLNTLPDLSALSEYPAIKQLQQQQEVSLARLRLEKSKRSPDLFAGYNNTSMKGFGADDKYYSLSKRFQSVQVGVGIPLFSAAQKNNSKAMNIGVQVAQNNYDYALQNLTSQYQQALQRYNKNLETVNYYETSALKNAAIIIETANQQFINGDINYLDWVVLTNQAISIQSEYIEAVRTLNTTVIEINTYMGQ